ncbi:MAG TPA: lactate utilization protein LutB domain-containing protein, partial [Bryobacteraceae bacterium]|nr:lactate utilization protein LutB domain-containing protein [Bryobacteraceae bacterium]
VCPVKINIPEILIHLRNRVVENGDDPTMERLGMKVAAWAMGDATNLAMARSLGRIAQMPFASNGAIHNLPGMMAGWTATRDMPSIPKESFRQWWSRRKREQSA